MGLAVGQPALLVVLLGLILSLLCARARQVLERVLHRRPVRILLAPILLTAVFSCAAVMAGAASLRLVLLMLGYTAAPAVCAFVQGPGPAARPSLLDFLAILLMWLPLELAAGASMIPRPAQGFLHSVAYGVAILLSLVIFLGFRSFPGMRFNLPVHARDYWMPVAAFAIIAPILAVVGIALGFIPLPHAASQSTGKMISSAGLIFAGTALPEEILFRSLIQNFLMLRFGSSVRTLLVAAFIFGCAHLNNGPQALPNWRYMILATIAGWAYGVVFQRSSTVLSSAALHTMVDWTKHVFF